MKGRSRTMTCLHMLHDAARQHLDWMSDTVTIVLFHHAIQGESKCRNIKKIEVYMQIAV